LPTKRKRRRHNKIKKLTAADIVYSSTELVHLGIVSRLQPSELTPSPAILLTEYTSQMLAKAVGNNDSPDSIIHSQKEDGEDDNVDDDEEVKDNGSAESDEVADSDGGSDSEVASYSLQDIASLAVNAFDLISE
jgi:hypothetical protein